MTDKQIIKKFSDGHCLVLENDQISLREDELTAYRIVLGKSTNELLEFVKDTYLQLQAKEQECEELKKCLLQVQNASISLNKQLDKLKVENEILKEKLVISSNSDKKTLKIIQTLAEIKEIAEENIRIVDLEGLNGVYRRGLAKQILQKISEVENG